MSFFFFFLPVTFPALPPAETPGNVSASIKTATSKSKKPNCSQSGAKAGSGSPQSPLLSSSAPLFRTQTPKSSYSPLSFPPNDSPSTSRLLTSEERHSYPNTSPLLRSTFTLTPSSSTDSALLPKICPSGSFQPSPRSNLRSPKQSQTSLSVLSDNQAPSPMSHMSPSPKASTMSSISSETNNPVSHRASIKRIPKFILSVSGSSQDVFSRSRLSHEDTHGDTAVFLSSNRMTTDHASMSQQYTQHVLSDPSQHLNDTQSPVLTGKDEALSTGESIV